MAAVTTHRGPDDEGSFVGSGLILGMRRLSIIDLSGGQQPIPNEDETIWVVCNGEIYNFQILRRDLQKRGHRFKSKTDSEVLVHLYEEYADDCVNHLNGMFAFALWDETKKKLLVGRDRLGIKPLYYLIDDRRLVFASEAKAILALPDVTADIDPHGLQQYLHLGYVPAPYSLFRGIRKLPIASLLRGQRGKIDITSYWKPPLEDDTTRSDDEWTAAVRNGIERSVAAQMVSDVPLGAFLSGGIDSSAVVAFMSRHTSRPVRTYSIGFDTGSAGSFYNELDYARMVAEHFNTDHREIMVRPDAASLLPKLLWHMDEPVADSAFVTTYLIAEFARREVTVILSGVGGDELFGGYRRYLSGYLDGYYRMLPSWIRRRLLQPLGRHLPSDRHSPIMNLSRYVRSYLLSAELPFEERYRSYVQVFGSERLGRLLAAHRSPGAVQDALDVAFGLSGSGTSLNRILRVDMHTQLPDDLLMLTDRMTMATSLECRVPLLDHELAELSLSMPSRLKINGRQLKYVLKRALKGILPDTILSRRKRGFGAPMGAWLRSELFPLLTFLLSRKSVQQRGLFRPDAVHEAIQLHSANREDHTDHLLALMNFEIWCRLYLDRESTESLSDQLRAQIGELKEETA